MKIAFLTESFFPFSFGGSEWSIYYLAQDLVKKKHNLIILTPNLGTLPLEQLDGLSVVRFPFYIKSRNRVGSPQNIFYTNPLWLIWASLFIFLYLRKRDVDIIHVHGKYALAPARIANIFLKKKLVATIRDYQLICNYGFCLYEKNKSCNIIEFLKSDFIIYWQNYVVHKNLLTFVLNLCFALNSRLNIFFHRILMGNTPVVALSKKQGEILSANGFNKIKVVGNSVEFKKLPLTVKKQNNIVFAGRLTPGKGVNLLISLLPSFFKMHPEYKVVIAGEGFLKSKLLKLSKKYKKLKVLGELDHHHLLSLFKRSKLVVVPSIWPEPFGRIPIESLSQKTPVVVSNKGGLPEIIQNTRWGYVAEPDSKLFLEAVNTALTNIKKLQANINKDFDKIREKYSASVTNDYLNLYNQLLK